MDIDALTDDDRKQLAKDLAAELDTGLYGNRAVLSRRQLLTLAGGSAGVAGLVALGVDPATAQSAAGQVGTEASPEDIYAFDLDVQNGAEFNGSDVAGVGSLSTPKINLGQNLIKTDRFTLSDDSAISFSDYEESQWFYLMGQGADDGHAEGVLVYQKVNLGGATDDVDTIFNTELTGTTGTDGQLSLSMSDTTLYIENRVGREVDYRLIRIQGSPSQ